MSDPNQRITWSSDGLFSEVVPTDYLLITCSTISWQYDRPRYDVAYVELIAALNIIGYLWNSQELMAILTRLCLQHTRWMCLNFFPGDGFKWITLSICWAMRRITFGVKFIMRVFHGDDDEPLLYCNFERNRPTELFHIAKHALRGNRKFNVVRLCSKLVGDSLWSSGLCMPNFRQIVKKICDAGVKPPSI